MHGRQFQMCVLQATARRQLALAVLLPNTQGCPDDLITASRRRELLNQWRESRRNGRELLAVQFADVRGWRLMGVGLHESRPVWLSISALALAHGAAGPAFVLFCQPI